jgi:tetratricopeptide (TPR) repeat protein
MPITSDYIEEYLNHQLTIEERTRFDEKLAVDEDFAREVEEHVRLFNSFDEMKAQELLLRFGNIEQELEGGKERQFGFPVYLKWAATVTVLAVLSLVVYLYTNNSNQDLFLAYYTTYPNVESPVLRSDAGGEAVWRLYENGDYEMAYQQFEQALIIDGQDLASQFYLGICALELNKLNAAEEAFANVAADKEGAYFEQAQWYLALTYLKVEKQDIAIQGLEEIITTNSGYSKKASALLGELK